MINKIKSTNSLKDTAVRVNAKGQWSAKWCGEVELPNQWEIRLTTTVAAQIMHVTSRVVH